MSPLERTKVFQLRVTDEELAMMHALAGDRGISAADIIRMHIRSSYRETFGDRPALVVPETPDTKKKTRPKPKK